jgi:hypothetical protein
MQPNRPPPVLLGQGIEFQQQGRGTQRRRPVPTLLGASGLLGQGLQFPGVQALLPGQPPLREIRQFVELHALQQWARGHLVRPRGGAGVHADVRRERQGLLALDQGRAGQAGKAA